MLPAFVVGLREGLEAALIVGIVAVFLRKNGNSAAIRWVLAGVSIAVVVCLGFGIALRQLERNLPIRQQEGLETIVALVAVAFVTYMVVWMRKNGRNLSASIEAETGAALAAGSVSALVTMAFLAVFREGFETSVFLVAVFQDSADPQATGIGAVLGIGTAILAGFAIYRGGIEINLARFFRVTGVVLVLVAAGLVASAAHTAHAAGWVHIGQSQALDLEWLVRPGSVVSALFTGVLGIQPRPTVAETLGWTLYAAPTLVYLLWPCKSHMGAISRRPAAGHAPPSN
ncbi:MAG: iron uptake transporter permease EfeU [Dehalococcoidia bacterium]|nr:FTR1 family protein [Dehalococcoidia bacterium]MCB9486729.1 FTR1 family protein [Thermoflexaceae bacterium]